MFTRPAWAELRVVLVVPSVAEQRDTQIATRLRAELVAAGFDVRTVPSTAAPSILLLKTVAEREAGAAAVAIVSSPESVSGIVWMRDERAERVLVRRVPEERRSVDSPAVFAIRATDLLHGGLLQLGYPRPKPPTAASGGSAHDVPVGARQPEPAAAGPRGTPKKMARTASREPSRLETGAGSRPETAPPEPAWEVMAGASSLWGPGGDSQALPWMFAPSLGLEWCPLTSWVFELRTAAPAFGIVGSSTQAVNIDQEVALLGAGWRGRLGSRVRVAASAGPALYRLGVRGQQPVTPVPAGNRRPGPPGGPPPVNFLEYSDVYWYGCAYGGAGLELYVESRFAVRLLGDLVVPLKRATIRLSNRQTVQSGTPLLIGTLGLALRL
ncbi:MAG: hypothetical protein JW940_06520 [Polyangiaceae bacterium]|nr:hypothetical protein [Polyangiaceae bacterium]